ncbi:hypothetical protein [Sessilibacter corallicola]|uniref:hypothetical protein n=1 Tax=Sessilibacter corallicola TaxID=2904075 RepID=UPI001E65AC75|nr:hypothetical protein [Sessilibacter corallicola]MCE2030153.1 hypothetical protein [Sessilibacter corallicola]
MVLNQSTVESKNQSGGITADTVNIININNPIPASVLSEVQETLIESTAERPYSVLLCPPSEMTEEQKNIVRQIRDSLESSNFEVFNSQNPDDGGNYPHIAEAKFIASKRYNSVIIFAADEKTLSKLSTYTYIKEDRSLSELDMPVVKINKTNDKYFENGCLRYVEDTGKVFCYEELCSNGVDKVIKYLNRRRSLNYRQDRGRRSSK